MVVKKGILFFIISCFLVSGCAEETAGPSAGTPFLGGTEGMQVSFINEAPPAEVFAGGEFPFDIVVRVENQGEFLVTRDKISVAITGINPAEFGVQASALVQSPLEDILPTRKDPQGNVIEGTPVFVEFKGLNHVAPISGSSLTFPIRADVCYEYGTLAITQLCIRKNILNPQPGGLCEVNEAKTVYNSGAPVHIENVKEFARSKTSIGLSFDIVHKGKGAIFEPASICDKTVRSAENRVFVTVRPAPGANADISCTGISEGKNSGFANLYGAQPKTITCNIDVGMPGDFQLPIEVELRYDYEQTVQKNIIVKATG